MTSAMSGTLKTRTRYLTHIHEDGSHEGFYAPAGARVEWDGLSSNAGHEEGCGGRRVLWCKLPDYMDVGLTYEEVEWNK